MDVVGAALFGVSVDSGKENENEFVTRANNIFNAGNNMLMGLFCKFSNKFVKISIISHFPVHWTFLELHGVERRNLWQ